MKFKVRFGSLLIAQIVIISCNLLTVFIRIVYPSSKDWFDDYGYIFCFVIILLVLPFCYRELYAAIFRKPVLTVNESFIYDFVGDVKYYWKDIVALYEKHSYLYISLHKPVDYIAKVGNPVKRLRIILRFKSDSKRSSFVINIDNVAGDPTALLKILNNYSTGTEN